MRKIAFGFVFLFCTAGSAACSGSDPAPASADTGTFTLPPYDSGGANDTGAKPDTGPTQIGCGQFYNPCLSRCGDKDNACQQSCEDRVTGVGKDLLNELFQCGFAHCATGAGADAGDAGETGDAGGVPAACTEAMAKGTEDLSDACTSCLAPIVTQGKGACAIEFAACQADTL